jgi:hypothetical protein
MSYKSSLPFRHQASAFLLVLFLLACRSASAWYNVTNYEGHVGGNPIHFSIQKYEHFGSGLNIDGSYYYDRHMAPIPLYGKLDEAGRLSLCEIHSDEEFDKIFIHGSATPIDVSACPFQLELGKQSASGHWAKGERKYEVALNETARLENTGKNPTLTGKLEIPFWGQTAKHAFIGIYEPDRPVRVNVVNKRSRQLVQLLQPEEDCFFGFFMTAIYMNVERYDSRGSEQVLFNCYSPKANVFVWYKLNKSTGKFKGKGDPW